MKNSIIETSAIAAKEAELNRVAAIASRCNIERREQEAVAAGKAAAVAAATVALADIRVAVALGATQPGAEAAAVVGLAAAQKALAAEAKTEGDIAVMQAQEVAYAARVTALQAELSDLRADRQRALLDAQTVELTALVGEYTALAPETMRSLARAFALHQHLTAHGRDPGLLTPELHASQLGGFVGSPLDADITEVVARERLRLSVALGA